MAYQTTKPAPNDNLDVSVSDIQQNFLTANTVMNIDHYPFDNVTSSKGKHQYVRFPVPVATPVTAAGEVALYNKNDPAGAPQVFLQQQSNATEIQMTKTVGAPVSGQNGVNSATYYTFLPGNLILITGFTTNTVDQSTITMSMALTSFLSVILCPKGDSPNSAQRPMVCQPASTNAAAGTMVVNFRDTNNSIVNVARVVYFTVIALT